jgi:ubiquinone/menaquinone biosynthesis C-methylase UbiE
LRGWNVEGEQRRVDELFGSTATYWRDIYAGDDFNGSVYRRRRDLALRWSSMLGLGSGARALEIGCGAGLLAVGLARHGLAVDAVDTSDAMLELARRTVAQENLEGSVHVCAADAHNLPWDTATFSLVVALGVLPWLHSPAAALAEITRVLRPGGYVILSADNSLRLAWLLDPFRNPALSSMRIFVRDAMCRVGLRTRRTGGGVHEQRHSPRAVSELIAGADLHKRRDAAVGFEPLTFNRREILSPSRSQRLDARLQQLADSKWPIVHRLGNQYVVLAQAPDVIG